VTGVGVVERVVSGAEDGTDVVGLAVADEELAGVDVELELDICAAEVVRLELDTCAGLAASVVSMTAAS